MSTKGERSSFSSRLGFVLSAAGSAVGLGNIWRFPYIAAKYGGGIFLLVYLLLVLSFGYTMIIAESALGRRTKKSPVGAFSHYGKDWMFRFGGWINAVIPILIVPYYSVIGGWVSKYLFAYLRGEVTALASDDYFSGFITNGYQTEFWFLVFTLATMIIIYMGVQNGIERVSTIMMPILIVLALVIAVYAVTRPGAMKGVAYFLVPNFKNFSWMTVVAAMGQMFYSLSIAMGILMTFGSYMKDDVSIEDATHHVELFDTAIAVLAGLMIIPAVFAFSGGDPNVLKAGPSLMFITMPKIFANMGFGQPVGIMFFLLVLFAALTSAIAVMNDDEFVTKVAKNNRIEMARYEQFCQQYDLDYIPSKGNFITIDFKRPAAPIYEALLREGVIVRPIAGYGMPNHLRVSIGLPQENDKFFAALIKVLDLTQAK